MNELEQVVIRHINHLNENLKSIDLGFWNKKGEYVEDIQEIDLTKEGIYETQD